MNVLCIHGIGHQELDLSWQAIWIDKIHSNLQGQLSPSDVHFLEFDKLFEPKLNSLSRRQYADAVWQLSAGWWRLPRERWLFTLSESEKWTLGMVAVFVNDASLRSALRELLENEIKQKEPTLLFAHSLGSLMAYDTLGKNPDLLKGRSLITFGSQIGNEFVQGGVYGGRVAPLPQGRWFHLYNKNDPVFTAALESSNFRYAPNFSQILTPFGSPASWSNLGGMLPDLAAHDSAGYLDHDEAKRLLYPTLRDHFARPRSRSFSIETPVAAAERPAPNKKALLIGINNYANPDYDLEGCVNDAYRMSEVLQECGFQPEDIRLVLDNRATAEAIRERLQWLLEDVLPGDTRVLAFSGHGTQLPLYGMEGQVDRIATVLAPHDFNWSLDTAISDQDLMKWYANLPYEAHFVLLLDCCHAGGISRGGGRTRGLNPPDDIRHRLLRWNVHEQSWESRILSPINKSLSSEIAGEDHATLKLGTAVPLRPHKTATYNKLRKEFDHLGPYMPIVLQACAANQKAEEYLHGATVFGAFTHALTTQLRLARDVTFLELLNRVKKRLQDMGYPQTPDLIGPDAVKAAKVPWSMVAK
jgi:pimeloyl-ACP methyl ester carboxylesterase